MINKAEVGNRICSLRKGSGFSQAAFAEKLGVSAQAVSKWETGQALPDVDILLGMSWLVHVSINEILEGGGVIRRIANRPFEMKDIALFVPEEERAYNSAWAKRIIEGEWTKRNWEEHKANRAARQYIGKKIAEHGGVILEIGAGPGGGYMPAVLLEKPDANVIISDLSPTVVREWKRLFDAELNPPHVSYAAIDHCDIPFSDNSVDVISSGGGFGNTEGDKYEALSEIYRVLKPGGIYVSGEGYVTQETLRSLPEHAQAALLRRRPDIFEDFYDASVTAGFKTIDNILGGGWSTKDDDSAIADLARELGIELVFTGYLRYCTK